MKTHNYCDRIYSLLSYAKHIGCHFINAVFVFSLTRLLTFETEWYKVIQYSFNIFIETISSNVRCFF